MIEREKWAQMLNAELVSGLQAQGLDGAGLGGAGLGGAGLGGAGLGGAGLGGAGLGGDGLGGAGLDGDGGLALDVSIGVTIGASRGGTTQLATLATVVLHENTFEQSRGAEAGGLAVANLMRIVFDEVPKDAQKNTLPLLDMADAIESFAEQNPLLLPLPIYASSTPSGRLVANVCAFSAFDETRDAIECLLKITQKTPLELTQELAPRDGSRT